MSRKRFSGEKGKKNGFYLALAVCLVAVGIAVWSTYEAVQSYLEPDDSIVSQEETDNTDKKLTKPTATPVPPNKAQETDAQEEEKPAKEESSSEPSEPATEKTDTPGDETGPLDLISEVMVATVSSEEIIKEYSKGTPVFSSTMKDWRIHTGTDFKAETGEDVKSCANGVVKETKTDPLLGNIVAIEHGDYIFYYCGLGEQFEVEPGEIVSSGQTIGKITAVPSESADAPHLHLEVRRDNVYMDPAEVLAEFKG